MTYPGLLALVTFAAFFATVLAASTLAAIAWPLSSARMARRSSARRAAALIGLALVPSALALIGVFAVVLPAFASYEPRNEREGAGLTLIALALLGASVLLAAARRGWTAWRVTRHLEQEWLTGAEPAVLSGVRVPTYRIEHAFPVVAVAGAFRPRLFIAGKVLDACTPGELAAIGAHEAAHIAGFDNLKRLALECCPDPLSFGRFGARLRGAWLEASEDCADDAAAGRGASGALDLAGALVKVARMAPESAPHEIPASALYRGENIARRVHRLTRRTPPAAPRPTYVPALLMTATFLGAALVPVMSGRLEFVHSLIETAVRHLP